MPYLTILFCCLATLLCAGTLSAQEYIRPARGGAGPYNGEGNEFRREGRGGRRQGLRRRPIERASYVPLELHGIIGTGDNALVSITDATTRESLWVRVRDSKAKWYVESVNTKACSAVVSKDGVTMDLKMIRTTGEPMSITSPAMPQALGVEAPGVLTAASESVFDPQALAAQVVAFQAGGQMTPEQQTLAAQSLGEELRAMTPEQRRQVSEVLRQRTPMTPIPSGGVNLPASNAASPASPSRSRAHISGSGTLPLSASHANVPASTDR